MESDQVVITVADTGVGMEPAQIERMFDMFTQARSVANRNHGGLGIGLALVRSIVELHGGRVEASSAGLGKGSEFRVLAGWRAAAAQSSKRPWRRPGVEARPAGRPRSAA